MSDTDGVAARSSGGSVPVILGGRRVSWEHDDGEFSVGIMGLTADVPVVITVEGEEAEGPPNDYDRLSPDLRRIVDNGWGTIRDIRVTVRWGDLVGEGYRVFLDEARDWDEVAAEVTEEAVAELKAKILSRDPRPDMPPCVHCGGKVPWPGDFPGGRMVMAGPERLLCEACLCIMGVGQPRSTREASA